MPAYKTAEPSAFVETEQVKLEIVPVRLTQGTPCTVMLRSLSWKPIRVGSDNDIW